MPANYVLLERIELNASAASVTFSNIPQTGYTDLKVVVSARASSAGINNATYITLNGLTTNFTGLYLQGNGASASSSSLARYVGQIPDSSATASTFSNTEIYFPNYTSSTNKSFSIDSVQENNTSTAGQTFCQFIAGLWSNSSAITSIMVEPTSTTFVSGSTFSLYGLAAVGTTPAIAPKASGGNITTDGTYWYHTFLASGTFTPQVGVTADVLVVAGGGGGSGDRAGGGGAGGLCVQSSRTITANSYSVTVGGGGAGTAGSTAAPGASGANTIFDTITALGGGGGRDANSASPGVSGGSGGGGAGQSGTAGGAATQGNSGGATGFGNAGGAGVFNNNAPFFNLGSGGGGGAGAAGSAGTNSVGGAGGAGYTSALLAAMAAATSTGVSNYYAGGGGGGATNVYNAAGGSGGGGNAGASSGASGSAGVVNTGSGGGGGAGGLGNGGAGGSGIVIIRYLAA